MNMRMIKFALIALLVAFAAGCRTAPVYNIDKEEAVTSAGKAASEEDVRKAIVRAGARMGWVMKDGNKGEMIGTLRLRKHVAVVSITYGASWYSVKYKDSTGLDYDGANIHSNYNGWIQNLQRNINAELTLL